MDDWKRKMAKAMQSASVCVVKMKSENENPLNAWNVVPDRPL